MHKEKKQNWKSEYGFIWSVLGSVVGFANIISFSANCYKNGGGAFLLPYFFAYALLGIPMLLLEGLIGQKTQNPLIKAYGTYAGRIGKFFGWLSVFGCVTIGGIYIVLTSYSCFYTYFGFASKIPADTGSFFFDNFLNASPSLGVLGGFSTGIFLITALVGIFVWWVLTKDIAKGLEKVCTMIMPLLGVFVITFAILASFLPGALDGVLRFLRPDFSKLSSFSLWRDVFGQLFFSLSLGLGIITGYARYNEKSFQLRKSMSLVALGDFVISFISGWVIFGCIGYMSLKSGLPFESIVESHSTFEIGYIIFPKVLMMFPGFLQPVLATVFFISVFIAGITGLFSIVESIAGNIQQEKSFSRKRAVSIAVIAVLVVAACFCFGNGSYLMGAITPMILGTNMLITALAEIIVFFYIAKDFNEDPLWGEFGRKTIGYYSMRYFVLFLLLLILGCTLGADILEGGVSLLIRWVWFAIAASFASVLSVRGRVLFEKRSASALMP